MDLIFDAFGVPATVTRPAPDHAAIETTATWVPEFTEDAPAGGGFARREPRRILALLRSAVPTVPLKTIVLAPLVLDGVVQRWRVDGLMSTDAEHHRVVVVEYADEES
jgi:hypothetical protein